jgi:Holliday junction resolvase
MPNKNYIKGRNHEYEIIRHLKQDGYDIAQRTAGSHSQIDVIAINKETKEILLIQAKPNNLSESAIDSLCSSSDWLNGEFKVKFEVR